MRHIMDQPRIYRVTRDFHSRRDATSFKRSRHAIFFFALDDDIDADLIISVDMSYSASRVRLIPPRKV